MSGPPSVAGLLAALLRGQEEMRRELAEVRAALEERRPVPDARDEQLLRLIFEATEGRAFSSYELIDFAELLGSESLLAALVAAVGEVKPQRVGKLLERLATVNAGGVVLMRVGRDRLGVLWRAQLCK